MPAQLRRRDRSSPRAKPAAGRASPRPAWSGRCRSRRRATRRPRGPVVARRSRSISVGVWMPWAASAHPRDCCRPRPGLDDDVVHVAAPVLGAGRNRTDVRFLATVSRRPNTRVRFRALVQSPDGRALHLCARRAPSASRCRAQPRRHRRGGTATVLPTAEATMADVAAAAGVGPSRSTPLLVRRPPRGRVDRACRDRGQPSTTCPAPGARHGARPQLVAGAPPVRPLSAWSSALTERRQQHGPRSRGRRPGRARSCRWLGRTDLPVDWLVTTVYSLIHAAATRSTPAVSPPIRPECSTPRSARRWGRRSPTRDRS